MVGEVREEGAYSLTEKTAVHLNTKQTTKIHFRRLGVDLEVLPSWPAVGPGLQWCGTVSLWSGDGWVNSPHLARGCLRKQQRLSVLGLSLLPQPLCLWALSGPAQPLPHTARQ